MISFEFQEVSTLLNIEVTVTVIILPSLSLFPRHSLQLTSLESIQQLTGRAVPTLLAWSNAGSIVEKDLSIDHADANSDAQKNHLTT